MLSTDWGMSVWMLGVQLWLVSVTRKKLERLISFTLKKLEPHRGTGRFCAPTGSGNNSRQLPLSSLSDQTLWMCTGPGTTPFQWLWSNGKKKIRDKSQNSVHMNIFSHETGLHLHICGIHWNIWGEGVLQEMGELVWWDLAFLNESDSLKAKTTAVWMLESRNKYLGGSFCSAGTLTAQQTGK